MNKIILSLVLSSSLAFTQTIDFDKALELTLQNNKQIKNTKLDIDITKENKSEILGVQLGKLEFSHEASNTNHPGYVFNSKLSSREVDVNRDFAPDVLNNPDDRNNFTSKISYNLPIFTGFKISNQKISSNFKKKQMN